jgi:hypothetical protein
MKDYAIMTDADRKEIVLKVLTLTARKPGSAKVSLARALEIVGVPPQTYWRWKQEPFYQEALVEWRKSISAENQDILAESAAAIVQGAIDIALGKAEDVVVTRSGMLVSVPVSAKTRLDAFTVLKPYMRDLLESEQQQRENAERQSQGKVIINMFVKGSVPVQDRTKTMDMIEGTARIVDEATGAPAAEPPGSRPLRLPASARIDSPSEDPDDSLPIDDDPTPL